MFSSLSCFRVGLVFSGWLVFEFGDYSRMAKSSLAIIREWIKIENG